MQQILKSEQGKPNFEPTFASWWLKWESKVCFWVSSAIRALCLTVHEPTQSVINHVCGLTLLVLVTLHSKVSAPERNRTRSKGDA